LVLSGAALTIFKKTNKKWWKRKVDSKALNAPI
jgi:hypothetical protein